MFPLIVTRYKCKVCEDYDLCGAVPTPTRTTNWRRRKPFTENGWSSARKAAVKTDLMGRSAGETLRQ